MISAKSIQYFPQKMALIYATTFKVSLKKSLQKSFAMFCIVKVFGERTEVEISLNRVEGDYV